MTAVDVAMVSNKKSEKMYVNDYKRILMMIAVAVYTEVYV